MTCSYSAHLSGRIKHVTSGLRLSLVHTRGQWSSLACKQTVGEKSVFLHHTTLIINLWSVHGYSGRTCRGKSPYNGVHACWASDIEMSSGVQTLNTLGILRVSKTEKMLNCWHIKAIYGLIAKFIWIEYLMDDGCTINTGPHRLRGFHKIDIQACLPSYRY